jgi:hypothetical protein
MQQNADPKTPRGEPQLVGLTRIRYEPASLNQEEGKVQILKNYSKFVQVHRLTVFST